MKSLSFRLPSPLSLSLSLSLSQSYVIYIWHCGLPVVYSKCKSINGLYEALVYFEDAICCGYHLLVHSLNVKRTVLCNMLGISFIQSTENEQLGQVLGQLQERLNLAELQVQQLTAQTGQSQDTQLTISRLQEEKADTDRKLAQVLYKI